MHPIPSGRRRLTDHQTGPAIKLAVGLLLQDSLVALPKADTEENG